MAQKESVALLSTHLMNVCLRDMKAVSLGDVVFEIEESCSLHMTSVQMFSFLLWFFFFHLFLVESNSLAWQMAFLIYPFDLIQSWAH